MVERGLPDSLDVSVGLEAGVEDVEGGSGEVVTTTGEVTTIAVVTVAV